MTRPNEGRLVADQHVAKLKQQFEALNDKCKATIREIAEEAHGTISLNPPTERRVGIARALIAIGSYEEHIDKDLVRSLCELRTGKKYQTAGAGLADLSWIDAERVWSTVLDIQADRVTLEYIPASNHYTIKENIHVR